MMSEVMDVHVAEEAMNGENHQSDWTELLEEYSYKLPKRGQVLEGQILRIDEEGLLVDVGAKRDAIVPSRELEKLNDELVKDLTVGKEIYVYVTHTPVGGEDLIVSIERGLEYQYWDQAERLLEEGDTVELAVVGENKGGLLVQFGNLQGFVPNSQIPELRRTRDWQRVRKLKEEMSGDVLPLKVIEVDRQRNRLIMSARDAEAEVRQARLKELEAGQIIEGQVVKLVDFGAFVDLDGVDGLIHISELDWNRLNSPSEAVKVGDTVNVKVLDVDVEKERISLSRKALLPNPWDEFAQNHVTGEVITGKVTKVVDFGAFVELAEGIEGLVHISQLGYTASENPTEAVKAGEEILVRILDIEPKKERVRLSMRQVPLEQQLAWVVEREEAFSNDEAVEATEDAVAAVEEAVEGTEDAATSTEEAVEEENTIEAVEETVESVETEA